MEECGLELGRAFEGGEGVKLIFVERYLEGVRMNLTCTAGEYC